MKLNNPTSEVFSLKVDFTLNIPVPSVNNYKNEFYLMKGILFKRYESK